MEKNQALQSILDEISHETEALVEGRTVTDVNTFVWDMLDYLDNPTPENKERIDSRLQKYFGRKFSGQAVYAWNGTQNMNKKFLNWGKPVDNDVAIEGDLETYRDPLWFYAPQVRRDGPLPSYLDENGFIKPEHKDIINRVNNKYGLNLNPNEKILYTGGKKGIAKETLTNNEKQFQIWRDKFFVPWYMENSSAGFKGKEGDLIKIYKMCVTKEIPSENPKQEIKDLLKSHEKYLLKNKLKDIAPEVKEEPYDQSLISSVIDKARYGAGPAVIELNKLAKDPYQKIATPQQIYNTALELYRKVSPGYQTSLETLMDELKKEHPELKGKLKGVDESNNSWLSHNGDYSVFDKLNNLFRLKKESKETNMINDKCKLLKEENSFTQISTTEKEFDPSKVTSDVFNDDNEAVISEKDELKKNKLTKKVLDKINQSISLNKEVQDILDEIRKINNTNDYNTWIVNEEGNTATLANKNAKIFKQNLNLCLSHDNKIEIFKSVAELHNWLKEHNYPLPKNIQLHESVNLKEDEQQRIYNKSDFLSKKKLNLDNTVSDINNYKSIAYPEDDPRAKYNGLGAWIRILGLDVIGKSEDEAKSILNSRDKDKLGEDFCCGNMGDTTSASLGTALQYLYKNKKKESLEKGAFIDKLKQLKEDDTDIASNFDSAIQSNAGFGSDSSTNDLGATDNSSLSSNDMQQNDAVDLGQGDEQGEDSLGGFGDINIDTGGYGPDDGNSEEDANTNIIPEDEYQIVAVESDSNDNIRVKVKNLTSGEVEYKNLSEIDV